MANMLKGFWPNGPQDQTTPKASSSSTRSEESNPFDTFSVSSALPSTTNNNKNNNNNVSVGGPGQPAGRMGSSSNLNLNYNQQQPPTPSRSDSHSRGNSANNIIPGLQDGLRTPGGVTSQASIPTTSVSTSAPDFTMKLPPAKNKVESTATNSNPSSSSTRNTTSSRGHLTIKIVEARNLPISSSTSRPYAVVQFDKNEFIGREPIDSADEDAKGTAVPRAELQESNNVRARAKTVTPTIGKESLRQNPVWKHEVTFDVTHENCPIYISVYDREGEEEGFVGMREIRPRLVNKLKSDQWYPLVSKEFNSNENASEEDLTSGGGGEIGGGAASSEDLGQGEVRIEMKYEKLAQKKLTPRDFEYLKLIGRGTFGKVFQVRKKDTRRIYAMKVLSKREIAIKKEVTHTMGERRILEKSLDCPFLVGLKFSFQSEFELFFVTDYKSGGELFWHLQREGRFTEERARFYIAELVLALEHLHKFDIVYRDLKPENILLDATGHVALCDFGLSKPDLGQGQLTNTFCGTTEYLAPEVLLDESGYSKLVDFWSLGVLLFEMCCGWSPFYAEDTQQMYRNICFGKIKFPRGAIGDDGKQFVKGLLNRNPKHRLGSQRDALDLKEHSFFKDVDFVALAAKQLTPPFKPLVESDESVANFDPEFTETDLQDVAFIPGFDGEESSGMSETVNGMNSSLIDAPTIGTSNNHSNGNQGVKISSKKEDGQESGGEGALSRSVQDKFRGFSYSGTYEGSLAGSFGGRRGSGGMGGINLGMSKMEKSDEEKSDVEMDG